MSFEIGQHVYVAEEMWGTRFRAIIERKEGSLYHMVWADNGLSVVSPEHQLTPVAPLTMLAEVAE